MVGFAASHLCHRCCMEWKEEKRQIFPARKMTSAGGRQWLGGRLGGRRCAAEPRTCSGAGGGSSEHQHGRQHGCKACAAPDRHYVSL